MRYFSSSVKTSMIVRGIEDILRVSQLLVYVMEGRSEQIAQVAVALETGVDDGPGLSFTPRECEMIEEVRKFLFEVDADVHSAPPAHVLTNLNAGRTVVLMKWLLAL